MSAMTDRKNRRTKSKSSEYEVGYGRPPTHSRFKAGQSGNPKGRARESRSLQSILKQVLGEQMEIREGDRLRRMPRLEALVRSTILRAFKGDPKAVASLGFLMKQSGYGEESNEPTVQTLLGTDYQSVIDDFLERHAANGDGFLDPSGLGKKAVADK